MNTKYITLNYEEYMEMKRNIEVLVRLLSFIYFSKDDKLEEARNKIRDKNKIYGWWV